MMRNHYLKSRGFTLIELIVTIFIFSFVIIIAASSISTGFMTGRLHSTSSQEANRNANLFFDILGQKMANANANKNDIYGFRLLSAGKILAIASQEGSDGECTYFGIKPNTDALYMKQQSCVLSAATPSQLTNKITSDKIKVTDFSFEKAPDYNSYFQTTLDETLAPYLFVTITLEDSKTNIKENFQSAYNIPYATYSQWVP